MTIKKNNAEGGSNGTTVTTGNSGGASGDAWDQVINAVTFTTAAKSHGSVGYHFAPTSGNPCRVRWSTFNSLSGVFRYYNTTNPTMSLSESLVDVRSAGGLVLAFYLSTGGKYMLHESGGTETSLTSDRQSGDRIKVSWTVGTTTSNGSWDVYLYRGDSSTVTEHISSTTANLGTVNWTTIDFGKYSGSTLTSTFDMDDIAVADGTTNLTPTATFMHTETDLGTSVDGTGSTAITPATVSSYSWDWGDSSTDGTGSTASHTYSAGGTYTVTLTVTDSFGQASTASHSVTVTSPGTPWWIADGAGGGIAAVMQVAT